MEGPLILEACLNGDRLRADHPDVPISADELAREARAVVAAGADAIHAHPREPGGRQTMGPRQCSAAIAAMRAAAPHTPVGVTTVASIEPDPSRRVALLRRWTEKPDFVSVNWSEDGAAALLAACVERGIGIEAGIWTEDDARRFADSGLTKFCLRALVEPLADRGREALAAAERMVKILAPTELPLVVHGHDRTAWAVLRWAVAHGHGIRIGLEDALTLEGGLPVRGNAELVAAAKRLAGR